MWAGLSCRLLLADHGPSPTLHASASPNLQITAWPFIIDLMASIWKRDNQPQFPVKQSCCFLEQDTQKQPTFRLPKSHIWFYRSCKWSFCVVLMFLGRSGCSLREAHLCVITDIGCFFHIWLFRWGIKARSSLVSCFLFAFHLMRPLIFLFIISSFERQN